jgi:hypothetical protein
MAASSITSALATIASAAATTASEVPASTSVATASSSPKDGTNNGECQLLGPFAVIVQAALGLLALLSLVFKRWRERPQRPVKVWAFDASKQVFGSALLHLANLLMSMFSSGELASGLAKQAVDKISAEAQHQPNPCSYYLLNLGIDTTIGIPILICILKVLNVGASYTPLAKPPESIKSGYYGDPPKATWWLKQSFIYFAGLVGMKICVFIIFQLCPWLVQVGDWALRWTEGNEAIQIAFVMLIFPLIMNGIQYYIVDIFIKNKEPKDKEAEEAEHDERDADDEQGGLLAGQDHSHHGTHDEEEARDNSFDRGKAETDIRAKESLDVDSEDDAAARGGASSGSLGNAAESEAVSQRPRI